jgi:5-methylcytosine-specific restriction endonuclease McrA
MAIRGNPVAWESFYKTARWRRLRKFQLMQHPLCQFCLQRGIVTAAKVVDHVTPHKGDWTDFVTGALQSLCEPCHNSAKRQIEERGYRLDIGVDGYPTDPNHPFYRAGWSDEN